MSIIPPLSFLEASARIKWLSSEIARHNILYHSLDKPEITDQAFDMLCRELENLYKQFPSLRIENQNVGAPPNTKFGKIKHSRPMLSLNNAFSIEDVAAFLLRISKMVDLKDEVELFCEPKIDGLSFSALYKNGKLVYGATRGDGTTGEDITSNLKVIKGLPHELDYLEEFEVRGEVYMNKKIFLALNQKRLEEGEEAFANPRNAAAGSLRQLNWQITQQRELDYFIWGGFIGGAVSQQEMLSKFSSMGFKININSKLCKSLDELESYYNRLSEERASLDYDIDGLVYKVNDLQLQKQIGEISRAPRWAIAHKFPAESAISVIEDIIVQVGRTGALTPVAILAPINVGGVLITRATLHNEDEIHRKDIRIGDHVVIMRAGDVIPQVLAVDISKRPANSIPYSLPKNCPVCSSPVIRESDEAVHRCIGGMRCDAQVTEGLKHFVSKKAFNIVGLGNNQIEELYQDNRIRTAADIFRLEERDGKDFIPLTASTGWGIKSVENLFQSINQSKVISLERFIYSLGIRHVGEMTALYLAKHFKTQETFIQVASSENAESELQVIENIGYIIAQSIAHFFRDQYNIASVNDLLQYLVIDNHIEPQIQSGNSIFSGKKVIFTGILESMSRSSAEEIARSLGATIVSSISKKTDYLIVGKDPGSKLDKAQKLGVTIIKEDEWLTHT